MQLIHLAGTSSLALVASIFAICSPVTAGGRNDPQSALRPRAAAPAPILPATGIDEFDPDLWAARLTDGDLDRREAAFEELVALAARVPEVRAWLEARAAGADELAWTARLARRELERAAASPVDADPLTRWFDRFDRFDPFGGRDPFESLRGADPFGRGRSAFDALEQLFRAPGALGLRVQVGPDGVQVQVEEVTDGERSLRTYRAESLEALLQAHPELTPRIGAVPGASAPAGGVRTDILGVRVAPSDPSGGEPEGLVVFDTEPGTVAHLLGVSRGDLLLELNGRPLRAVGDISEALAARTQDGEIRLRWRTAAGAETVRVWGPGAGVDEE